MNKSLKVDDVVELLLNEKAEKKKIILLFEDNRTLQRFSDKLGDTVKANPNFVFDRRVPFVVRNNIVQYDDRKVYLGLKVQELALKGSYDEEEIHFYEKPEAME